MSVSQILASSPAGIVVPSVSTSTITATGNIVNIVSTAAPGANIGLTHNDIGEVRIQPQNSPPAAAGGGADLVLFSKSALNTSFEHYVTGTTGGGLTADEYTLWGYGTNQGKPYFRCPPPASTSSTGVFYINGGWLDPTRRGTIVGTGAAQIVAVNSILAGSIIDLIPVAGAAFPAAVPAAPVITPAGIVPPYAAGSFTVTLPAGTTYNYYVWN